MSDQKKGKKEIRKDDAASSNKSREKSNDGAKSVYAKKRIERSRAKRASRAERTPDEYEQRIVDIARVTRVMAGGKRMRFRACVAIGNKKGKVGVGLDKGADVTIAVTKAVNDAKKKMIDIPIVNDTIPHEIFLKLGAAKILLKPARRGKGVIAGGAARTVLELSGIKNITSKILGTNNNVNVAKGTIAALDSIKKVEVKKKPTDKGDKKPTSDKTAEDKKGKKPVKKNNDQPNK
jgi:small subunit ribosomal protein S5